MWEYNLNYVECMGLILLLWYVLTRFLLKLTREKCGWVNGPQILMIMLVIPSITIIMIYHETFTNGLRMFLKLWTPAFSTRSFSFALKGWHIPFRNILYLFYLYMPDLPLLCVNFRFDRHLHKPPHSHAWALQVTLKHGRLYISYPWMGHDDC